MRRKINDKCYIWYEVMKKIYRDESGVLTLFENLKIDVGYLAGKCNSKQSAT